ncbi:hypothetical protein LNQ03_09765 [Klebsiella pneumoniae subsp. pneumoniae]|nr:hypothetical protein [Klebsiella pneumoniae subsp. pneumoniae]
MRLSTAWRSFAGACSDLLSQLCRLAFDTLDFIQRFQRLSRDPAGPVCPAESVLFCLFNVLSWLCTSARSREIRGAALDWAEKANKTEQRDNKDERGALPGDRVQHS